MSVYYLPSILLSIARNPVTAIGLPLALGTLSGSPTAKVVRGQWYNNLHTPPGRPPRKMFPIAWSLLYISMGYASHLAVKALDTSVTPSTRDAASLGLTLYYGQLALNLLWSPLFFGYKEVGLALIDCTLATGTTYYMTKTLDGPTNGKATIYLLPYCAWLTFATYLNGGIWWLNRGRFLPKTD